MVEAIKLSELTVAQYRLFMQDVVHGASGEKIHIDLTLGPDTSISDNDRRLIRADKQALSPEDLNDPDTLKAIQSIAETVASNPNNPIADDVFKVSALAYRALDTKESAHKEELFSQLQTLFPKDANFEAAYLAEKEDVQQTSPESMDYSKRLSEIFGINFRASKDVMGVSADGDTIHAYVATVADGSNQAAYDKMISYTDAVIEVRSKIGLDADSLGIYDGTGAFKDKGSFHFKAEDITDDILRKFEDRPDLRQDLHNAAEIHVDPDKRASLDDTNAKIQFAEVDTEEALSANPSAVPNMTDSSRGIV